MTMTQKQYEMLKLPYRRQAIRIFLIDRENNVVDTLEGTPLGGSISIDGDSTYRRSGSVELSYTKNSKLLPKSGNKIWFHQRVGIEIGLYDNDDEIVWYNLGRFAVLNGTLQYSSGAYTLSLELADYMAYVDGSLGGTLPYESRIIGQGVPINTAIAATLSAFTEYTMDQIVVNGLAAVVPYDIEKGPGATAYEIIKELLDLYMDYEFFYDQLGFFVVRRKPNRKNDPVLWDFSDLPIIDYSSPFDFTNVKNVIYVWGKLKDDGEQIYWRYRNRFNKETIGDRDSIANMEWGDICSVRENETSYLWNPDTLTWEELDFSVIGDFSIETLQQEKFITHTDDKIFELHHAKTWAEFLLNRHSNLASTVDLNCLPLYGIEPNTKLLLSLEGAEGEYYVSGVSYTFPHDSSISAVKIY